MCPNDDNNILEKQEESKRQKHCQWVLMYYCKGLFNLQEIFLCNASAMEIKEPLATKHGELLPVLLWLKKGVDCLMLESSEKALSRVKMRWAQYARSSCLPPGTFNVGNQGITRGV